MPAGILTPTLLNARQARSLALTSVAAPVPDVEAAALVVGAVGGRGDLAVALEPGHPGLHVVLAVRRRAEVAARHVQHLRRRTAAVRRTRVRCSSSPDSLRVSAARVRAFPARWRRRGRSGRGAGGCRRGEGRGGERARGWRWGAAAGKGGVGRGREVGGGVWAHLEVEPQLGEELRLNLPQLLVQRLALLRRAQHKHLHLRRSSSAHATQRTCHAGQDAANPQAARDASARGREARTRAHRMLGAFDQVRGMYKQTLENCACVEAPARPPHTLENWCTR